MKQETGVPRRFAIVEDFDDGRESRVVGWGCEFADRADFVSEDGLMMLTSSSAESARDLLGITGEMRLVWP
ncbi:MAG TPA: hypothetical protein VM677_26980 [Actinokineospora sp.]|jgi:hypothetical protein|nr:hypothetical protein [Actinokineospora sp.]